MELYQESAQLYRQLKDDYGLASNLENQGEIYRNLGKLEQALALTEESLKLFRKLGNKQGIASSLNYLATSALGLGDYERAKSWAEASLALTQELGDAYLRSYVLHNLAGIAQGQGEIEKAVGFFKESLSLRRQVGDKTGIVESLEGLADLAAGLGDWLKFLRLSGATETLREKLGVALKPGRRQAGSEKSLGKAGRYLGSVACEQARWEGRSFSVEEATNYALNAEFEAILLTRNQAAGTTLTPDTAEKSELTTREIEVLDLVAQGFTNLQIAEKLVISTHTVNRHLTNIYSKLGLTSRTEAVRYALQNSGKFQTK
jgi:DNA-binding CsgD family transcriptional regulator